MSIVKAIARLRQGAKERGLEGALASLGTELRSDAIPAPLRDAVARLATLLGPKPADEAPVSLERALQVKAESPHAASTSGSRAEPPASTHASHVVSDAGAAVCPFTGTRAESDGALAAAAPRDATHASAALTAPLPASPHDATLELPSAPRAQARTVSAKPAEPDVEARGSAREPDVEARGSAREPDDDGVKTVRARKPRARRVEARGSAREPKSDTQRARPERSEAAHSVETRGSAREPNGASAREAKRREKGKEGLAGERNVENTSARSATRSAPKQPRGRAQTNRKKV